MTDCKTLKTIGKYSVSKTIGRGLLKVKLVHDPETNQQYAAKVCKTETKKPSLDNEAAILREINKAGITNVVKIFEYIEAEQPAKKTGGYQVRTTQLKKQVEGALIMELASNFTIFDFLMNTGQFDEKLGRTYFKKLISVLAQLHSNGFVHRDIKSENLLLNDNYDLVLADFGFAKAFDVNGSDKMDEKLGTEIYMAPEMHTYNSSYSGVKIDMFACGALLFLMQFARPPMFKANNRDPFYKHMINGQPEKFWGIYEEKLNSKQEYNKDFKDLVNALLSFDPSKRPSANDVLENFAWMQGEVYSQEELIQIMGEKRSTVEAAVLKEQKSKNH